MVGAICALDGIHRAAFADLIHFEPRRRVRGYWLGIEVPFEGDVWGVDVVLQQRDWSRPDTLGNSMRELSETSQDAILAIKYELIRRGEYGSKYTSGELYEAVLKHEVTDVGAFDRWAAEQASNSARSCCALPQSDCGNRARAHAQPGTNASTVSPWRTSWQPSSLAWRPRISGYASL